MDLTGRRVVVTGGGSGIGRAAALRMAACGAAVAVLDLAEGRLPDGIGFYRCDVTHEDKVRAALGAASAHCGGLDALVSAAGILRGAFRSIEELETDVLRGVLDVNLIGTFLCCKHAAPLIEASGGGVIVCIASGAGVRGPSSSLAYGASKGGVQGLCYTLERQLAPRGIRVNVVCPGSLDTPMKRQNVRDAAVAQGRDPEEALAATPLGDPDGVARVLAFLASTDADYLLGTIFTR